MKSIYNLISFGCMFFTSMSYASDVELKLKLVKESFLQNEKGIAEIEVINVSTNSVNVSKPVEGANLWLEIRDSSNTYVGTRPLLRSKENSLTDIATLTPGGKIACEVEIPAEIEVFQVPIRSTTTASRIQDRIRVINLNPGKYYIRAFYFSHENVLENMELFSREKIWTGALVSNRDIIYVKEAE